MATDKTPPRGPTHTCSKCGQVDDLPVPVRVDFDLAQKRADFVRQNKNKFPPVDMQTIQKVEELVHLAFEAGWAATKG